MLKFQRCSFETDIKGFYITPLIGVDWTQGKARFWIGWMWWLFTIYFKEAEVK